MTFKYNPYDAPLTIGKQTYLFSNTCCLMIVDPRIRVYNGVCSFVDNCGFKPSDLKWLLDNNLVREVRGSLTGQDYVTSTGKKMEYHYWKFTDEALAMDKEFKKPYYRERKSK